MSAAFASEKKCENAFATATISSADRVRTFSRVQATQRSQHQTAVTMERGSGGGGASKGSRRRGGRGGRGSPIGSRVFNPHTALSTSSKPTSWGGDGDQGQSMKGGDGNRRGSPVPYRGTHDWRDKEKPGRQRGQQYNLRGCGQRGGELCRKQCLRSAGDHWHDTMRKKW